jgi:hypothetical protein
MLKARSLVSLPAHADSNIHPEINLLQTDEHHCPFRCTASCKNSKYGVISFTVCFFLSKPVTSWPYGIGRYTLTLHHNDYFSFAVSFQTRNNNNPDGSTLFYYYYVMCQDGESLLVLRLPLIISSRKSHCGDSTGNATPTLTYYPLEKSVRGFHQMSTKTKHQPIPYFANYEIICTP